MRAPLVPVLLVVAGALAVGGCTPASPGAGSSASPPPRSTATPATTVAPPPPATIPAVEPSTPGLEYRVSYDWAVPSTAVEVRHPLTPPIAAPPAPPLPYLVGIYAADHPEGSPAYQRISFYFRGAFPSYGFGYVPAVLNEGQGVPIPLQGNAFLRVGFVDAQAHSQTGASSVLVSPPAALGFSRLTSYGFAGDFEGHVTYGLGIQVAPQSDQAVKIRAGELKKPDGSGGFFYVVHFDVQRT
jgi:hypothetical protein